METGALYSPYGSLPLALALEMQFVPIALLESLIIFSKNSGQKTRIVLE